MYNKDIPIEYINKVVVGDMRELSKDIPDNSIDLIFTDPPYPKEYLDCYTALSEVGARVLKPGGLAFVYSGETYLPEVISRLSAHLNYRWTIALLHQQSQIVWNTRMMARWKPILLYIKGNMSCKTILPDVVSSDNRDKKFHKWGQGVMAPINYISWCTERDDVVFDPFCGGGTTAAVCKMLGRNYITFEIDSDTAKIARQRIEQQQVPFLDLSAEQMPLMLN
jgi:site-specific DNA-methyltransferase (adenine-specific)